MEKAWECGAERRADRGPRRTKAALDDTSSNHRLVIAKIPRFTIAKFGNDLQGPARRSAHA